MIKLQEEMRSFNSLQAEINGLYHDASAKLGLSDSASCILYSIVELGEGCTPREIYHRFGISRQTVHSSVSNLVKKGCLELRKSGARDQRIFLTEEGRKLVSEKVMSLFALENVLFENWTEKEKKELLRLMSKYRDDLKRLMPKLSIAKD